MKAYVVLYSWADKEELVTDEQYIYCVCKDEATAEFAVEILNNQKPMCDYWYEETNLFDIEDLMEELF